MPSPSLKPSPRHTPQLPWGSLPTRLRVLSITTAGRMGWLDVAFAADSGCEVSLEEVAGLAEGLVRLREELFDAVLLSHEPPELDCLDFVDGLRAGGAEEPMIVLGAQSEPELFAQCCEVGADAYVCVETTTTRNLLWVVGRAVEYRRLIREHRRLAQGERRRLQQEHSEANRLLEHQRGLIRDLEVLYAPVAARSPDRDTTDGMVGRPCHNDERPCHREDLPPALISHYRELLRAHVVMGSGNLAAEMNLLAELLVATGVTARQAMQMHLGVLEELVRGLGSRSARHVMTRADLLVLEVMVHLAEDYRRRYEDSVRQEPRPPTSNGLDLAPSPLSPS